MPRCNWLSAFITAVLFPLVDAFYYIDDNNSSITYGAGSIYTGVGSTTAVSPWVSYPPTPIANSWFGRSVDPEKTFGGTYHYFNWPEFPEYRNSFWTMDIPFTGSGITFFVFSFSEVNVSIDGDLPRNIQKDCSDTTGMCYNTSLFDIQGLYTDKPHNLHVVCLDIQLFFDYVKVNDTVLLPSSPATSLVSSQTTTGGSQSIAGRSKSNIGAIVGGIVGGLVVIAVILFSLLRMRSRKKSTMTEMYAGPLALTGEVSSLPVAMDRTMPRHLTEPSMSPMSPTLANLDPTISKTASGTNLPSPSSISTPISAIPNEYTTALPPQSIGEISQPPVLSGPNAASNPLTDEQTEFVHNLYNLSVPAPAIASVMNRMIRENESGGGSNSGVTSTPPMDQRPPEYDFKAGEGD